MSDDVRWCQMMSDDVRWIFHDFPRPKWPDKNPKMWLEFSSAPKISMLSKLRSSADKPQDSRDLTAWPNSPGAGWVLRHSHDIRSPHDAERFQDIQSQGHFIFEVNMIKPLRYHMGRLWKAHTQLCEFAVVKVALSVRCGLLRTNQPPSMCDEHGSNICALNQDEPSLQKENHQQFQCQIVLARDARWCKTVEIERCCFLF